MLSLNFRRLRSRLLANAFKREGRRRRRGAVRPPEVNTAESRLPGERVAFERTFEEDDAARAHSVHETPGHSFGRDFEILPAHHQSTVRRVVIYGFPNDAPVHDLYF